MRPLRPALALIAASLLLSLPSFSQSPASAESLGWPELTKENKPWTRWWWPGSGVDQASLTRQLEQFAAAGLGGVEITPIYGAKGYEDRYIDFLSPKWVEMLAHTGREAQRLGLGVDMATGTGWPFGGPWVPPADAAQKAVLNSAGQLVAEPTKQLVKRPAPGGEGFVLDPYSPDASAATSPNSTRPSPPINSRAASSADSSTTPSNTTAPIGPRSSPKNSA